MRFYHLILPKGSLMWCGTALIAGALLYYCKASLFSARGLTFLGGLIGGIAVASWVMPSSWVKRVAQIPPLFQNLVFALLAYMVVCTLGLASETRSLRSWWELLTFSGIAPFSFPNALGFGAALLAVWTPNRYRPTTELVRGPGLISHQEAHAIAAQQLGQDQGFIWGGVPLPFSRGTDHFCVVGEPGSGKTKTIQLLLRSVLGTIQPGSNRRAILYDAKRGSSTFSVDGREWGF